MEDLPYEIWQLIVNHLPDEQVRQLYSVNRALLNIALDLRYQEASLRVYPDRSVKTTNPQIQVQDLLISSSRPTCLRIIFHDHFKKPDAIQNTVQAEQTSRSFLKLLRASIVERTTGSRRPNGGPASASLTETTSHVIPQLTRVAKVSFAYANEASLVQYEQKAASMFSEILGFIGNRLQSLHIQSHFAAFLSNVRFECLISFAVDALGWYHTNGVHDIMAMEVPSFLLAHESTIRNVSFSIDNPTLQVSPILYCLQSMFCLTDISLVLPYAATMAPFEGQDVLLKRRHNLKSLSLNIVSDTPVDSSMVFKFFFQGWWFPVNVPKLIKLTIRIPRTFFSQGLSTYLQPFSFSLVSLKFTLEPYSQYPDITGLCKMVADFPALQEFSLNVFQFSPTTLAVFARSLPHLRSLHIDYSLISQYKDPRKDIAYKDGIKLFDRDMVPYAEEFSNWELESLNYTSPNHPPNDWIDGIVAVFLPNVLWICQQPRYLCLQTWQRHLDLQTSLHIGQSLDKGSEVLPHRTLQGEEDHN